MQSFLKDADASTEERVRTAVDQIRDLAYDIDDVIDTFNLEVASKRRGAGCVNVIKRSACILKEGWTLHKLGSEIKAITSRISGLTEQLQRYGVQRLTEGGGSSSSYMRRQQRRSYPHIEEHNVIGIDDNIKELVTAIVVEENHLRVALIWGMGGLGKTTLAKEIYRHIQIKSHFDHFAWAYVSQQCQTTNVLKRLILGLAVGPRDEILNLIDEELPEKLHQVLREKKCLVILDDVWKIEDWKNLKVAFPNEQTGSVILITSRNKEVASDVQNRFLHPLQPLNEDKGWELLQKIAISERAGNGLKIDSRREELGKKIVNRCGGLPLAITVIGGLLTTKHSINEWETVSENIQPSLKKGKGYEQGNLEVNEVLALSYDYLSLQLKPCFLYLGHFPVDYTINVRKLIQMWVAEGFITSDQNQEREGGEMMEDVAEDYLNELIERCMVLVAERDASLRVKTCRLHDLMRDLCLLKAKEENFLHVFDHRLEDANARRLAIHEFVFMQQIKGRHLSSRSLLLFNQEVPDEYFLDLLGSDFIRIYRLASKTVVLLGNCRFAFKLWRSMKVLCKNFKLLRVLDAEGSGGHFTFGFSKDIGNLIHLRFLCLNGIEVCKLPSSLGNLRFLQTLDLRVQEYGFNKPLHIPDVIWKIEGLRHLYLPDDDKWSSKTRLRLGTLRHLQTLVNFRIPNCDARDLLNLTNLRDLTIKNYLPVVHFREILKSLSTKSFKHLQSLLIKEFSSDEGRVDVRELVSGCVNLCELDLRMSIEKLPDNHQFSPNITSIALSKCQIEEDPMPTLEKLPNLRVLELSGNAFIGRKMVCSTQGFPKLHSLGLFGLNNLEEWRVDEGAMPNLCKLEIGRCLKLKTLPDGLRFTTTIQELKISSMPKAFKDNLVQGGEDFYKVQHVPSIVFEYCD